MKVLVLCFTLLIIITAIHAFGEGTRQFEPIGAPIRSYCKIALTRNYTDSRIPFALINCTEEYRLNIHIKDFTSEKIYLGFGDIIDYYDNALIYTDLSYQIKDPNGNVLSGFSLRPTPNNINQSGYIATNNEALSGPDINNSNPSGYKPIVITPSMNGDYILEFALPGNDEKTMRIINYIDVTVANGLTPISGRLWSKAWQLSSGNVDADVRATYTLFYVYSSDSVVTRFDCNGLAGGVWAIYSNEWGCGTSGIWNNNRRSIVGNATVEPQHKIFLNDPDPPAYPSGHIGEMIDFEILPSDCDTVITFRTNVSKGGNIEVTIDVPPYNPISPGPEDVQLGYNVSSGQNTLLPAWNGKNALGIPVPNGTAVEAHIRFLNGLSNIPLLDVEDNPNGFKVDIQRPVPVAGSSRLRIFWDDMLLPPAFSPTMNVTTGCEYTGTGPYSGCHPWHYIQGGFNLGDLNTINSWWYFITNEILSIPITIKLGPSKGLISGPKNICSAQVVTFRTRSIPFAQQYLWHIEGPGYSADFVKSAPDTTFSHDFNVAMPAGAYVVSVFGKNPQCGSGEKVFYGTYLSSDKPPPVNGESSVCDKTTYQYTIPGSYSSCQWSLHNGEIVGLPGANPVTIRWNNTGVDTLKVLATNADCGTRLSIIPVEVHPSAKAGFFTKNEGTSCPGLPVHFTDTSSVVSGSLVSRYWDWGNNGFHDGNDILADYAYAATGTFSVKLKVTTDVGCTTETSQQVKIIPYPEASFSCYRNCVMQPVQLTDNSTGTDINSWKWDFGIAAVATANLGSRQPEAMFPLIGTYPVSLEVANRFGCTDTVVKQLTIHKLPVAGFVNEFPCEGTSLLFTDNSIEADTLLKQFSWESISARGERSIVTGNPALLRFNEALDYIVNLRVTDAYGCFDTVSSVIDVKPKPECSFSYSVVPNGVLLFDNKSSGADHYYWNFGNGENSDITEPETTFNSEGDYSIMLIGTSSDGCIDTTVVLYSYLPGLWMPDAFSPDNNAKNDIFRPVTQRTKLDPYQLLIYNHWGQLIFKSTSFSQGWDGTYNGEPCPIGNYTYFIQYREAGKDNTNSVIQRGVVRLIR